MFDFLQNFAHKKFCTVHKAFMSTSITNFLLNDWIVGMSDENLSAETHKRKECSPLYYDLWL